MSFAEKNESWHVNLLRRVPEWWVLCLPVSWFPKDLSLSTTSVGASLVVQMVESTCNAEDLGSVPGSGRCPGEENGYSLQYACLENSMDRGACDWETNTFNFSFSPPLGKCLVVRWLRSHSSTAGGMGSFPGLRNKIVHPAQHSQKKKKKVSPLGVAQFSSVAQSCPTFFNPMDCSIPGFPVHRQLPEPTQIHVHWVSDAIQLSHSLSSPSPPTFNLSHHQSLFQWVSSLHQVSKVLEFQL